MFLWLTFGALAAIGGVVWVAIVLVVSALGMTVHTDHLREELEG